MGPMAKRRKTTQAVRQAIRREEEAHRGGESIPGGRRLQWAFAALFALAVIAVLLLLIWLWYRGGAEVQTTRPGEGVSAVADVAFREEPDPSAPAGVVQTYTFPCAQRDTDSALAFYLVHQYAQVWIGGELVYSVTGSGRTPVKTIGSCWVMVPLLREDSGKEVRVCIRPVYESSRSRQVTFLTGSRMAIFVDRLRQDLPQLVLSVLAVFIGITFQVIALYRILTGVGDDALFCLGLFSVMLGLWRLMDTRFIPFLVPQRTVFLFYTSVAMLMLGTVPLVRSLERRFTDASRRVLRWYCVGASAVCLILVGLQVLGGVDLRLNLQWIHFVICVGIAVLAGCVIHDMVRCRRDHSVGMKAALLPAAGVLLDLASYYVRGTSSGLVFTLLAMLIYIAIMGTDLMIHAVSYERQLARMERQLAEQEHQLAESRMALLISQIKPHFIYNTLGSIEQLCTEQPETAAGLVHNFARYLRGNFGELDNPSPIRLHQEMEHVQCYVSIEKIRFPDITVVFDLQSEDFLLPALSVQPLVENAIKHGLMQLTSGGTVRVSTWETEDDYFVRVEDNGGGFCTDSLWEDRSHVGLRNIRDRVRAMCGGSLEVRSQPGAGTTVTIQIPRGEVKRESNHSR